MIPPRTSQSHSWEVPMVWCYDLHPFFCSALLWVVFDRKLSFLFTSAVGACIQEEHPSVAWTVPALIIPPHWNPKLPQWVFYFVSVERMKECVLVLVAIPTLPEHVSYCKKFWDFAGSDVQQRGYPPQLLSSWRSSVSSSTFRIVYNCTTFRQSQAFGTWYWFLYMCLQLIALKCCLVQLVGCPK